MSKFKVGDVVRLVSGGAQMVVVGSPVSSNYPPHWITCAWHGGGGEPFSSHYPPDVLVTAASSPAPVSTPSPNSP